MAGRLARSWSLLKASAAILRSNKNLLVYPLLSAICALIVAASFLAPAMLGGAFAHVGRNGAMPLGWWLGVFAFYLVQYSVIFFFNSALVGAALMRLDGHNPTLADGFHIAISRLPAILGYALIAATVGMLLRALQERAGFIGRWIIGLLGVAWTVATFLTIPVLVSGNVGPIDAIKQSAGLLRQTWGENIAGTVGMGFAFGLIMLAFMCACLTLLMLAVSVQSAALIATIIAIMFVGMICIGLFQSALQGVYAAALYRYASTGDAGAGFEHAQMADAFRLKA